MIRTDGSHCQRKREKGWRRSRDALLSAVKRVNILNVLVCERDNEREFEFKKRCVSVCGPSRMS